MFPQSPYGAPLPTVISGGWAALIFVLFVSALAAGCFYGWWVSRRDHRARLKRSNPAKFWLQMTINEEASAILERTLVQNVLTEEPARRKR